MIKMRLNRIDMIKTCQLRIYMPIIYPLNAFPKKKIHILSRPPN